jgi:NADH dehydrogenase
VQFFAGEVEKIDLPNQRVTVFHGSRLHSHVLDYDHLVIAPGSVTNFFNLPGLAERALTMKTLEDAVTLRNRLIACLEEADTECACDIRRPLLTFVVAGGGFAGVETIAAINDFAREALTCYPHIREELIRMVLVEPGEFILPELGPKLGVYAQKKLAERGVEIRVRTRVAGVDGAGVHLSDGTLIETQNIIWTAGTAPSPLLAGLPCEKQRGRVVVNEFLEVPGWPGVWSLGDCAVVPDLKSGKPYPPTAQHAIREGRVLARNIVSAIRGGQKRAFSFKTIGLLAAIGRRTGVASILGYNFSGFLAWWMWRTIYLSKLPRLEKKVRVALDWTLDLLFAKDLVQYQTFRMALPGDAPRNQKPVSERDPVSERELAAPAMKA